MPFLDGIAQVATVANTSVGRLLCPLGKTFSLLRTSTLNLGQPELQGQGLARWVTGSEAKWGTPASTARRLPLGNLAHRQVIGLKCAWRPGGLRPVSLGNVCKLLL